MLTISPGVRRAFAAVYGVPAEELACSWDNPFFTPRDHSRISRPQNLLNFLDPLPTNCEFPVTIPSPTAHVTTCPRPEPGQRKGRGLALHWDDNYYYGGAKAHTADDICIQVSLDILSKR